MMAKKFEASLDAVTSLVNTFRFERYFYAILTGLSVIVLIVIAVVMVVSDFSGNLTAILAMFLPSGAITFSCFRLLHMFSMALNFVSKHQ